MEFYTSEECLNDMARARFATKEDEEAFQAKCDKIKEQEMLGITPDMGPEEVCQKKMSMMLFQTQEDMDKFKKQCLEEQEPGYTSEIRHHPLGLKKAGIGNNMLIWLVVGGVVLWVMNKEGYFKK